MLSGLYDKSRTVQESVLIVHKYQFLKEEIDQNKLEDSLKILSIL
jgi:hypothetical protein